jgi:hypothetical protein
MPRGAEGWVEERARWSDERERAKWNAFDEKCSRRGPGTERAAPARGQDSDAEIHAYRRWRAEKAGLSR